MDFPMSALARFEGFCLGLTCPTLKQLTLPVMIEDTMSMNPPAPCQSDLVQVKCTPFHIHILMAHATVPWDQDLCWAMHEVQRSMWPLPKLWL